MCIRGKLLCRQGLCDTGCTVNALQALGDEAALSRGQGKQQGKWHQSEGEQAKQRWHAAAERQGTRSTASSLPTSFVGRLLRSYVAAGVNLSFTDALACISRAGAQGMPLSSTWHSTLCSKAACSGLGE